MKFGLTLSGTGLLEKDFQGYTHVCLAIEANVRVMPD